MCGEGSRTNEEIVHDVGDAYWVVDDNDGP